MLKARLSDRSDVIDIITESFQSNPSVLAVIKNDNRKNKRIRALASYAFDTAISRDGVYISTDRQGVAICYSYNYKPESLTDYWNQAKLVINAIGIFRVLKILKRDAYVKKQRPASGEYLYFWFLGVKKEARGNSAAKELKNILFQEADNKTLPIYLETSVNKNKIVYERYGFEVYHTWNQENGDKLWFMKRSSHN